MRQSPRIPIHLLLLACVISTLPSCSDDRPVGDTLKAKRNVDELISGLYIPGKRAKAANRLAPFARFVVKKLTVEVTDVSKNSPVQIEARLIMLEMLGRLDHESEIDGLLIRINRDSAYPQEMRTAASDIARARAARRAE